MNKVLVFKLVKTICLAVVWICIGLYSEITGVTLQDLRERTQSNYEVIGQAVSMRMIGYGAGVVCGGWILDKFKNAGDLVISVSLTIAALVCVAIAYTPYVELMFVEFSIQGITEALVAIVGQLSLAHIWKNKISRLMYILHLGYGVGSFLAPQIVKPFLSERSLGTSSKFYLQHCHHKANVSLSTSEQNSSKLQQGMETFTDSNFEDGYHVILAIVLTTAFIFVGFYYCFHHEITDDHSHKPDELKEKLRQIFNISSCLPGHPRYTAMIVFILFLWYFMAIGGQMIFANYLYSYCRDVLCVSKDEAANILSIYYIGFTTGRVVTFLTAIWVPMKVIMLVEAIGSLVSALVLYFNPADATIVWIFSGISGLFVGPLYPSGIAWASRYLTMTRLIDTITLIGGSLAGITSVMAVGWLFQNENPSKLWYFVIGYSILACVLATWMCAVTKTKVDTNKPDVHSPPHNVINEASTSDDNQETAEQKL